MASVREGTKPGSWRIEIYGGVDANGNPRRTSTTFHGTHAAAKREARRLEVLFKAHGINASGSMSVADLCRLYVDHQEKLVKDGERHKSAPRYYVPVIRKWIAPEIYDPKAKNRRLGGRKVSKINGNLLQDWIEDMKSAGLSSKTIRNHVSVASSIFGYARKDLKIIDVDPFVNLRLPTVHKTESSSYTSAELLDITEAIGRMPIEDQHYKTAFLIMIWGGLRRSEVAGLDECDVDYDHGEITIRQTRQYLPGSGMQVDRPKSAAGARTIAMPAEVMAEIKTLQERQEELKEMWGDQWSDTPALLKRPGSYAPKRPGDPVDPKAIYRAFGRLCKTAGVENRGLHALRHTHASIVAAMPETTLKDLQERLGHAEASTTLDIYTHLFDDNGHKIADAISRHFFQNKEQEAASKK